MVTLRPNILGHDTGAARFPTSAPKIGAPGHCPSTASRCSSSQSIMPDCDPPWNPLSDETGARCRRKTNRSHSIRRQPPESKPATLVQSATMVISRTGNASLMDSLTRRRSKLLCYMSCREPLGKNSCGWRGRYRDAFQLLSCRKSSKTRHNGDWYRSVSLSKQPTRTWPCTCYPIAHGYPHPGYGGTGLTRSEPYL